MTENEVELLAKHLGHDTKTHKENYRLSHSTRELTKVQCIIDNFFFRIVFLIMPPSKTVAELQIRCVFAEISVEFYKICIEN